MSLLYARKSTVLAMLKRASALYSPFEQCAPEWAGWQLHVLQGVINCNGALV